VANGVFNFTTITIPAGVSVHLTANRLNTPVYWLATGKVDIEGTLDLSGAPGAKGGTADVDKRLPAAAGSGGYAGGVGGNTSGQYATSGSGPGGGAAGTSPCVNGVGGSFADNQFLIPLVGGSGGGGNIDNFTGLFGGGGGAGGGAILVASSNQIIVKGTITANGGGYQCGGGCGCVQGAGSGGAVRLVSNTISGSGTLTALRGGGASCSGSPICGQDGRVRLEANTISFTGSFNNTPVSESTPLRNFNSFIPSVPQPSVRVTSINGTPITENPFTFPDITINTDQPVPVIITGHQVPVGTTANLIILGESADQDSGLQCTLAGTLATSTCTISVKYAFGGSRGLVKATWQNSGSKWRQHSERKPAGWAIAGRGSFTSTPQWKVRIKT
jgi:hypothetical protein